MDGPSGIARSIRLAGEGRQEALIDLHFPQFHGTTELEPADRDVVILRNLHELDWKAVGQKTGRSPDAARMLWARVMQSGGGLLKENLS